MANGKWQMVNEKLKDKALFMAKLPTKGKSSSDCKK
jgi:hypothetical protein